MSNRIFYSQTDCCTLTPPPPLEDIQSLHDSADNGGHNVVSVRAGGSPFVQVTKEPAAQVSNLQNKTSRPEWAQGYGSYPRSAGAGHGGPEEAPPVGVLKDVRQDAGEQPRAVQHRLSLLLWGAARVGALDQFFHRLWGNNTQKYLHLQGRKRGTLLSFSATDFPPVRTIPEITSVSINQLLFKG